MLQQRGNAKHLVSGLARPTEGRATRLGGCRSHAEPQGYLQDELGVGDIYGTFDPSEDVALLVGGTAEDFCNEPGDPFEAEPGSAPLRVFLRNSGAVDLKVNDRDQPIHL